MKKKFWIFIGLGLWVFLSPWILGFSTVNLATWGNLLGGLGIIISTIKFLGFPKE